MNQKIKGVFLYFIKFSTKILHNQFINICFPNRSSQVVFLKPNIWSPYNLFAIAWRFSRLNCNRANFFFIFTKKSFYCRLFVSIFSELLFLYIGLFGSFLFNFLREKHDQTDDCKKKSNEQGNEVQLVAIFHLNSIEVVNGMLWYWKHFFKERI